MKVNMGRGKWLKNEFVEKTKVRAIIKTNDNRFLMVNYGGVLMFPGGKLEDNEYLIPAILRKLEEELGVEYSPYELEPLIIFKQIQPNYLTREGKVENRIINTFYYVAPYKGIDLKNRQLSQNEKEGKVKLEFLAEYEINEFLHKNKTKNPRKKYFNEELENILKTYNYKTKGKIKTLSLNEKHLVK